MLWLHCLVRVQVHVFDHKFSSDFYGLDMVVLICGFLRYSRAILWTMCLPFSLPIILLVSGLQYACHFWRQLHSVAGSKCATC